MSFFDDGTLAKDHWHQILMKTATRLLDLHNRTLETLVKYRQSGEQRINVIHQHLSMNDNSKAIVSGQMIGGQEGMGTIEKGYR